MTGINCLIGILLLFEIDIKSLVPSERFKIHIIASTKSTVPLCEPMVGYKPYLPSIYIYFSFQWKFFPAFATIESRGTIAGGCHA